MLRRDEVGHFLGVRLVIGDHLDVRVPVSSVALPRHRRRRGHVYCAGMDVPVLNMAASAEAVISSTGTSILAQ